MLLAQRGGKLKCLIFPLLMERQLLGYPRIGRYEAYCYQSTNLDLHFKLGFLGQQSNKKYAGIDHFFLELTLVILLSPLCEQGNSSCVLWQFS